jgi:hypothetical protein
VAGLLETLRAEAQEFIRMALYDTAVAYAVAYILRLSHMYKTYI